jgi:hypothetical protein
MCSPLFMLFQRRFRHVIALRANIKGPQGETPWRTSTTDFPVCAILAYHEFQDNPISNGDFAPDESIITF